MPPSPDLNATDYKMWRVMQQKIRHVYRKMFAKVTATYVGGVFETQCRLV